MTWGAPRPGTFGYREERDYEKESLRYEVEQYREAEQRRIDDERRERERREQERREIYEERLRSASSWREALQKQAQLMSREARLFDVGDTYFSSGANACHRAMDIWREEQAARQDQIDKLEQQIAAIRDGIKVAVGERLAAESEEDGWQEVARVLREEADPENWLDW